MSVFALLGAAGVCVGEVAAAQAEVSVRASYDGNAGSTGSGGSDDPTDHGSNGSVLAPNDDPVQKEDLSRPHVSRDVEEEADGFGE